MPHGECINCFRYVMDAQNCGAIRRSSNRCGKARGKPLLDWFAGDSAQHPFSRQAGQNWPPALGGKLVKPIEQGNIMRLCFSETKSWIDAQALPCDSRHSASFYGNTEEI